MTAEPLAASPARRRTLPRVGIEVARAARSRSQYILIIITLKGQPLRPIWYLSNERLDIHLAIGTCDVASEKLASVTEARAMRLAARGSRRGGSLTGCSPQPRRAAATRARCAAASRTPWQVATHRPPRPTLPPRRIRPSPLSVRWPFLFDSLAFCHPTPPPRFRPRPVAHCRPTRPSAARRRASRAHARVVDARPVAGGSVAQSATAVWHYTNSLLVSAAPDATADAPRDWADDDAAVARRDDARR